MDTNKPSRLLYKLLAALIYTDIELRPRHELEAYATAICATIGEEFIHGKSHLWAVVTAKLLND